MSIHVYIDRLILDGLPLDTGDGPAVQAAIEAELTRLLTPSDATSPFAAALVPRLRRGGTLASVHGPDVDVARSATPDDVGQRVGTSIHQTLCD